MVQNLNNAGAGSLRSAIQQANADSGTSESISFQAGLTGTIALTSALDSLQNNIAITGPGSSKLDIERSSAAGTPAFRIFQVAQGKSCSISGLSMGNGSAPNDEGGAILNAGTLTV